MAEEKRPKKKKKTVVTRSVVITVDDAHLPKIDEVAVKLRSLGVKVDEVLEATGLICGSTDRNSNVLEKVPGVMSVEEQTQFQVPPSEGPIH